MGVTQQVEKILEEATEQWQQQNPERSLRVVHSEPGTRWCKLDHLLYLPVLGLERPWDLRDYQGTGLQALYGFTYRYLPLEQFLGQLTRLQVGLPLAHGLTQTSCQAWYGPDEELALFCDWHVKPHWTKHEAHSGPVSMWGRIMPGTKQLILNGPEGHLLGAFNSPIDAHLPGTLVQLEEELADRLGRPIGYTIADSEAAGLPLALRYAEAGRHYLTVLPRRGDQSLSSFQLRGDWQPVQGHGDHEAVEAHWADADRARLDPRRLVLMRPVGQIEPTRVYTGMIPEHLSAGAVPGAFRARWADQERRIRQLVNGANLNANYGYHFEEVPSRTLRRRWQEAQQRVEATERCLADHQEALHNLAVKWSRWRQDYHQQEGQLHTQLAALRRQMQTRQQQGRPIRQCQRGLHRRQQRLLQIQTRFQRRRRQLLTEVARHRTHRDRLEQERALRRHARDAIDTDHLVRERNLEKDQIMLNLQILLGNLHDWACCHYFAQEWQRLELPRAIRLIYSKSGRIFWRPDHIEVVLDPYRYPDQQRLMEQTCQRFNALDLRWRDGRRLIIRVASPSRDFQLSSCQGAGQA